jgi:diguanylate cyclase (GGDEF)-like protein
MRNTREIAGRDDFPRASAILTMLFAHYNMAFFRPSSHRHLPITVATMLTVASILATTALFSLAMLLVLGSLLRMPVAGVREWFAANLAMVVSLSLLVLRNVIPDFLSIVLGNMVLGLAGVLYYAGCARFLQRPPRWIPLLGGVLLVGVAMFVWRYVVDDQAARVVAVSAFNGLICLLTGQLLLRHRPRERNPYHFWFGALLTWLFAAAQFTRGGYFLIMHPAGASALANSVWNISLLTIGAVVMPTLTMVAVMLVHDALLARMEDAANHDHLTSALSRMRFDHITQALLSRATAARPLSLLLIDLDHFKRINDTWGHAAGDQVLRAFVQMARAQARPGDALGRLGGEEFGMLLPDTTQDEAMGAAERLRSSAEQHLVEGGFGACHYTLSIGVTCARRPETLDQFKTRADHAMYIAKNNGRNRLIAAPMETPAQAGVAYHKADAKLAG